MEAEQQHLHSQHWSVAEADPGSGLLTAARPGSLHPLNACREDGMKATGRKALNYIGEDNTVAITTNLCISVGLAAKQFILHFC